ncbi:DNA-directed DNA polymerase II small subunit [Methanolapillus africanus]
MRRNMDESVILEKASEAGFMINPDAISLLIDCKFPDNCLISLFSEVDTSVFVIEPQHIAAAIPNYTEKTQDPTQDLGFDQDAANANAFRFKYSFEQNTVQVMVDVSDESTSVGEYNQFVQYFRDRYTRLSEMIRSRVSSRPIESISKGKYIKPLSRDEGSSEISIIGMVAEKSTTNNQHMIIVLEDPTGSFPVLINQKDTALIEIASKLILDEVIGVTGNLSPDGGILMASKITQPDVPNSLSSKRHSEGIALFISDIHVGSKEFMKEEWELFLDFLNGKNENPVLREIAADVRYLVVAGDIVDGIGIYPNQEADLEIPEIYDQYRAVADYFHQMPPHIHIVVAPGNHDAVRRAEPQLTFPKIIRDMFPKNVTFVGNPALVSLDDVYIQIYHGCSMDDLVASIKGVSYQAPTTGMMEMVKRRHLAPTYGSRVMISPEKKDYLLIDQVPDIIHCGHVHTVGVTSYKNIILINSGTWQAQTDFQKKVNIMPTPAKVPMVDLKTMKTRILDFNLYDEDAL